MTAELRAEEDWKPVPDWEDIYLISDQGRLWSLKTDQPIYGSANDQGYIRVSLMRRGTRTEWKIHRLVMLAFNGPAPEGQEVCHIDGDKANNTLGNLRYGTRSENIRDQVIHGVHNMSRKTECPHGHEYTPENTRICRRGKRSCRECSRIRGRALRASQ